MKTRLLLLLNLVFLVCGADLASAFYDPTVGRWLNRDPVEEIAFQNQTATHRSADAFRGNLYWSSQNTPVNKVDSWGLITFDGCSQGDQDRMNKAIKDNCDKARDCASKCPSGNPISGVGGLCSPYKSKNLTIHCRDGNFGEQGKKCADHCGLTHEGSNEINLCPDAFDPKQCQSLECTLFHESLHGPGGMGEHTQEFEDFDKCMGCKPEKVQK